VIEMPDRYRNHPAWREFQKRSVALIRFDDHEIANPAKARIDPMASTRPPTAMVGSNPRRTLLRIIDVVVVYRAIPRTATPYLSRMSRQAFAARESTVSRRRRGLPPCRLAASRRMSRQRLPRLPRSTPAFLHRWSRQVRRVAA